MLGRGDTYEHKFSIILLDSDSATPVVSSALFVAAIDGSRLPVEAGL